MEEKYTSRHPRSTVCPKQKTKKEVFDSFLCSILKSLIFPRCFGFQKDRDKIGHIQGGIHAPLCSQQCYSQ